jgi:hypothetical protein
VEIERLKSPGAYLWEASSGERVFSTTTLASGFPKQSFEYAEIRNDANNITIMSGWATLDLQADGFQIQIQIMRVKIKYTRGHTLP